MNAKEIIAHCENKIIKYKKAKMNRHKLIKDTLDPDYRLWQGYEMAYEEMIEYLNEIAA